MTPSPAGQGDPDPIRVGLFGILGSGNIGNDASLEAVLAYLRARHPAAVVDAMCSDPEPVRTRYGLDAVPVNWYQQVSQRVAGPAAAAAGLKVIGKIIDVFRTVAWVGRHEVVIVPGMGVLEATLPRRAMGFPYALFLACAAGRLRGTRVALVAVGADTVSRPLTRWFLEQAARLAYYRSYRDDYSLQVMRRRGVGGDRDRVYRDLVFSLPVPAADSGDGRAVGVGVMAYRGGDDDRDHAEEIYRGYLAAVTAFVRWLLDEGRTVRLFVGDANGSDDAVVREIVAAIRAGEADLEPGRLSTEPVTTLTDLMSIMSTVGIVIATRYHNIVCALKLAKPTISISYAAKSDALMADAGLSEFCLSARSLDASLLIRKFEEIASQASSLRDPITKSSRANAQAVSDQFEELSAVLFGPAAPARPADPD